MSKSGNTVNSKNEPDVEEEVDAESVFAALDAQGLFAPAPPDDDSSTHTRNKNKMKAASKAAGAQLKGALQDFQDLIEEKSAEKYAATKSRNELALHAPNEKQKEPKQSSSTIAKGALLRDPDHDAVAVGIPASLPVADTTFGSEIEELPPRRRQAEPGAFRARPAEEPSRLEPGAIAPMPNSQAVQLTRNPDPNDVDESHNTNENVNVNVNSQDPVATPVQDEGSRMFQDLEAASPVEPEEEVSERLRKRDQALRKRILIYGSLLLVTILIVVLAPILVLKEGRGNKKEDAMLETNINTTTTDQDTGPPVIDINLFPGKYLQSLLPDYTQEAMRKDDRNATAQSLAYHWLLDDPSFYNYSATRMIQRYAMATVAYSLGMKGHREGWLDVTYHECHWETDYPPRGSLLTSPCNREEQIHQMWLYDVPKGTLPPEIGLLTSLIHLGIANALVKGPVPTQIGYLQDLEVFQIFSNQLTSHLPSEFGLLRQLRDLRVHNNHLSGSLPSELSELTRLLYFWGVSNAFTGSIPSELGLWPEIQGFEIFENHLTGTIPTELGLLTELGELTLDFNELTGPIPSELSALSHLALFFLHNNALTGTIPSELGLLQSVYRLYLYSNQLSGSLPTELGLLTAIEIANLHDNHLTGHIPSELGNWEKLWALYLNFNQQTGVAPAEWGDAVLLRDDYTWDANRFSGTLPSTLGRCTNLHYLWVPNSDLTGTIPTEFGLLSGLSHTSFANNTQLEGAIPAEVLVLEQGGSLLYFNVSGTAMTNGTGHLE